MEKYIVVKKLPDASIGTEVIWSEGSNCFYYEKKLNGILCTNYLSYEEVTENNEFFCKANEYPEYYAYKFPVYSREEILGLLRDSFPHQYMSSGDFRISVSREIRQFETSLRELGKLKAEVIIKGLE